LCSAVHAAKYVFGIASKLVPVGNVPESQNRKNAGKALLDRFWEDCL
jgi:hypothetical protein